MTQIKAKVFLPDGLTQPRRGKAFLGISLNNRIAISPQVFRAVFDWVATNVGGADLFIGDHLHRHNYQAFDGMAEPAAIEQALRDRDEFTARLRGFLAPGGSTAAAIMSASPLYQNVTFPDRLSRFRKQYASGGAFKRLIDDAVHAFLARKQRDQVVDEEIRGHCVAYQLEELVLFELLVEQGYGILIYAGAQLPIMKSIVSGHVYGASDALRTLTLIELRVSGGHAS
jgi:tRNA-dependent cyclodipeptide synthase